MYTVSFSHGAPSRTTYRDLDYATRVARAYVRAEDCHSAVIRDGGGRVRLQVREDNSEFTPTSQRTPRRSTSLAPLGTRKGARQPRPVATPVAETRAKPEPTRVRVSPATLDFSALFASVGISLAPPATSRLRGVPRDALAAVAPTRPGPVALAQSECGVTQTYSAISAGALDDMGNDHNETAMRLAVREAIARHGSIGGVSIA